MEASAMGFESSSLQWHGAPLFVGPCLPKLRRVTPGSRSQVCCLQDVCSLPKVFVLPGLDGTSNLLLESFRTHLSAASSRLVPINYPVDRFFSQSELTEFLLNEFQDVDENGFIVVGQSSSASVALRLAAATGSQNENYRGTVLVNGFCSLPLPAWTKPVLYNLPPASFKILPPKWISSPLLFGSAGSADKISAVENSVRAVDPEVMVARVGTCADENCWDVWRDELALPGESILYLQGESDALCGTKHARLMQAARPDIRFHTVRGGPHLLLQTAGEECARLVDQFCRARSKSLSRRM